MSWGTFMLKKYCVPIFFYQRPVYKRDFVRYCMFCMQVLYSLTISGHLQELVARFEPPILEGLASRMEAAHISSHRFPVFMACEQYISIILMGLEPQVNLNPINIQTPGRSTRTPVRQRHSTSNFSCFYMLSSCTVSFRNTVVFVVIYFFSSS